MYWITGILGVLLIIAPVALGYSSDTPALWSNVVLGLAVLIVSAIKGLIPDRTRWEYVIAGLGGLLAILAPFALHFSVVATALRQALSSARDGFARLSFFDEIHDHRRRAAGGSDPRRFGPAAPRSRRTVAEIVCISSTTG
jgi:hypothetical protein